MEHVTHRTLSAGLYTGQLSLPRAHPTPTHKLRRGLGLAQYHPLAAYVHTLWHAVLLKAYSVMCVGEVAHMRVLVSIISDFLHMWHSMFTREGMHAQLMIINLRGGFSADSRVGMRI